jgi:hypothetical protein
MPRVIVYAGKFLRTSPLYTVFIRNHGRSQMHRAWHRRCSRSRQYRKEQELHTNLGLATHCCTSHYVRLDDVELATERTIAGVTLYLYDGNPG